MKTKQIIIGLITLFTLFGMLWAANDYVAKQKDLTEFRNEFTAWKLEDQAAAIQKRIWYLQDRYKCPNCPNHITEYRQLIYNLKCITDRLKGYYKKS